MRYRELLTEIDTESSKFKQWFNGSKVIDLITKAPLICYHGTTQPHEIQPAGLQHFGTFKAANQRILDKLGIPAYTDIDQTPLILRGSQLHHSWDALHIYPVYLSIKHPVPLEDNGQWEDADIISQLFEEGLVDKDTLELFQSGDDPRDWITVCEELGYDGVVYENQFEDAGSTSWYPFSDHQVWNIFANTPY